MPATVQDCIGMYICSSYYWWALSAGIFSDQRMHTITAYHNSREFYRHIGCQVFCNHLRGCSTPESWLGLDTLFSFSRQAPKRLVRMSWLEPRIVLSMPIIIKTVASLLFFVQCVSNDWHCQVHFFSISPTLLLQGAALMCLGTIIWVS